MQYLITEEEMAALKAPKDIGKIEEWERQVRIWTRNFLKYFGQQMSSGAMTLDIMAIEERYRNTYPYPKLEDYIDWKS